MAKTIDMPTSPNFVKSEFRLIRTVGAISSPYTGKVRTQEYDGVFWEAVVSLPPMRRSEAVNWQSFLLKLNGPVNQFKFADPDALVKQGTYSGAQFKTENRTNESSATLSFTASSGTIAGASSTTYFNNTKVGDYIVITGSANSANNGTHKVLTRSNAYTITVAPVDADSLVDESNKSGCTIKCNVKGAKGLCLKSTANSHNGTVLVGDYLGLSTDTSDNASGYKPIQYLYVTEAATQTNNGGSALNQYGVRVEPKLRSTLAANSRVYLTPAKGMFRLIAADAAGWDADNISNYGISFSCVEVV